MNCHDCQKRIKTPRNDYSVAELIEMLRPKCIACNPAELPRGGRSQVEATDFTLSKRKIDPCDQVPLSANQADRDIRGVSPEAFDRFRIAMTTFTTIGYINTVIYAAMFNGVKYDDIYKIFEEMANKTKRYHGSFKQVVYARKNKIIEYLPVLKPIFDAIVRKDGKDVAFRRDVEV